MKWSEREINVFCLTTSFLSMMAAATFWIARSLM